MVSFQQQKDHRHGPDALAVDISYIYEDVDKIARDHASGPKDEMLTQKVEKFWIQSFLRELIKTLPTYIKPQPINPQN